MEHIHIVIVVIVIICIIGFQLYSYINTKHKIKNYKKIFPSSVSSYSIEKEDFPVSDSEKQEVDDEETEDFFADSADQFVAISQIHIKGASKTLSEIEQALNKYLQKNKGAASDFHLMKDVVERYCDADEEEISTQQPIPLYLGLMGTMVGIIVGIIFIAITHGFTGDNISNSVTQLMTCVAIAMSASLLGVYFTTRISWKSKNAFSKVEADKNRFYSWIQTELLPTLSGDTANALYLLQQNLATFNNTFQNNISGLNRALAQVKDTSSEQVELIKLIKDIDVRRVAQANVTVLKELNGCTSQLSQFTQYINNVSSYLTAVNNLNNNINEHLNRTAAIERMGAFFEKEINQVATREQYINQVVAKVDDTLNKTFESLSDSTQNGVSQLQGEATRVFDEVSKTMEAQQQSFTESLQTQRTQFADALNAERESFIEYLRGQRQNLAEKSNEIASIVDEIHHLSETKTAMDNLVSISKEQSSKIGQLVALLGNNGVSNGVSVVETPKIEIPRYYKVAIGVIIGLMALNVCVSTYSVIKSQHTTTIESPASKDVVITSPSLVGGDNKDSSIVLLSEGEAGITKNSEKSQQQGLEAELKDF